MGIRKAIMVIGFLIGGLFNSVLFLLPGFITRVQEKACPESTFLSASGNAVAIIVLPIVLGSFFIGIAGTFWSASALPWAARRWQMAVAGTRDLELGTAAKLVTFLAVIAIGISAILFPISIYNESCLTPYGVYEKNTPWSGFRKRNWSQVSAVETSCRYGRGGWGDDFVLRFSDGSHVDLNNLTNEEKWIRSYGEIREALSGHHFFFNPYAVDARCELPQAELLRTDPRSF